MLPAMPAASMLDREVYVFADVDRLIGLTPGTAKRWINGYERAGVAYDPVLRTVPREGDAWVTWGEFVEARILAEYRDIKKIRIARLRESVEELRQRFGVQYPLAHLRPYLSVHEHELIVGGSEIGLPNQEIARTGQMLIGDAKWIAHRAALDLDERGEQIKSELPADRDIHDIVINPDRYSGQPTFIGSRISPVTIAGMIAAGERREDVAADYGLSLQQVDNATVYTERYKLEVA